VINLRRRGVKERKVAEERVKILLESALKLAGDDEDLARRQVELARRIAMKYNLRNQKVLKRYFICRYCKKSLIPGIKSKIRVRKGKIKITCLVCGRTKRLILPLRHKNNNVGTKIK
jgi:ribonuclease P protein subunit RPR2